MSSVLRPKDSISNHGTQDSNFGKDPLGTKRMKDTDKKGYDDYIKNMKSEWEGEKKKEIVTIDD